MKKLTCTILISLSALRFSVAADARAPSPSPSKEQPRVEPTAIELKNKSSFTMEDNGRNPFWPIGWKPAAKISTNTNEHVGPEISPGSFLVSSIVLDPGAKFAIVNGK